MKNVLEIAPPAIVLAALAILSFASPAQHKKPKPPKSVRLYMLDCGDITGVGEAAFAFTQGQLAETRMVTPCYLVVHSRGIMMWDTGEIPDADFKGNPTKAGAFAITRPLLPQLAGLGYTPADINYLACSIEVRVLDALTLPWRSRSQRARTSVPVLEIHENGSRLRRSVSLS